MNIEVVWDGTPARSGRYLFVDEQEAKPAPVIVPVEPPTSGRVHVLRRKADDLKHEPLKLQIYKLLMLRSMAIGDIVAHFKGAHSQSKIYGSVSALRTSRHIHVVGREVRPRARGVGPMSRDIYGPTIVTQEMQL